jgi:hypothetical protein
VSVRAGASEHRFVAGWIPEGWPADVERLAAIVPDLDVVFAPHLSLGARAWLAERNLGWVDQAGRASVCLPSGLIVSREPPECRPPRELPARWTRATIAVAEAALAGVTPTVDAVEKASGLSRGVHRLSHDALLDLSSTIAPALDNDRIDWAVTGMAASALLAPYISDVTVVELYVRDAVSADPERLAAVIGGRVVKKGHRIEIREAPTKLATRARSLTKFRSLSRSGHTPTCWLPEAVPPTLLTTLRRLCMSEPIRSRQARDWPRPRSCASREPTVRCPSSCFWKDLSRTCCAAKPAGRMSALPTSTSRSTRRYRVAQPTQLTSSALSKMQTSSSNAYVVVLPQVAAHITSHLNRRPAIDVEAMTAAASGLRPCERVEMKNGLFVAAGILITLAGAVFALQGFNVLGGSAMSGDSVWAILGPLIAIAGLAILAVGLRRRRSPS